MAKFPNFSEMINGENAYVAGNNDFKFLEIKLWKIIKSIKSKEPEKIDDSG